MPIHKLNSLFFILVVLAGTPPAWAANDVSVVGLFGERAVVVVDGKRHVLGPGQSSPEGVRLIAVEGEGAMLEVAGQRQHYPLGVHISSTYREAQRDQVTIYPDSSGSYTYRGSINGKRVTFLIDTGADMIAINRRLADELRLDYRHPEAQGMVETASGLITAYYLKFSEVKLGEAITLYNVRGVVIDGDFPQTPLLGMSFLRQLDMQRQRGALTLHKR